MPVDRNAWDRDCDDKRFFRKPFAFSQALVGPGPEPCRHAHNVATGALVSGMSLFQPERSRYYMKNSVVEDITMSCM